MDPNATLEQLRVAVHDSGDDTVIELFDAMDAWLGRGGFLPADWTHSLPASILELAKAKGDLGGDDDAAN